MMKKHVIQTNESLVARSEKPVVGSKATQDRHDSEWSNSTTTVIKKNDFAALRRSLEEARKFHESYANNSDTFQVRASGKDISHGKIKFEEGLNAMTGLYEIIKHSARQALDIKGTTNGLRDYLDNCFLEAPQAGSFIYKANVELDIENDNKLGLEKGDVDFRRNINISFAKSLIGLNQFLDTNDNPNYGLLVQHNISEKLCDSFLHLFSESSEKLEFDFNWSVHCKSTEKLPARVVFNKESKEKIKTFKRILKVTHPETFSELPVYIEKIQVPMDKKSIHRVNFKCKVGSHVLTGSKDIDDLTNFDAFREKVGHHVMADVIAIVSDVNSNSNEIVKVDFDFDKNVQLELIS